MKLKARLLILLTSATTALWSGSGFAQTDQELTHYTLLGGNEVETGIDFIYDASSDTYLFIGSSNSPNFPMEGNAFQDFFGGERDGVFGKIDAEGNLIYSSFIGGSDVEYAVAGDVLPNGDYVIAGYTFSSDFPVENAHNTQFSGNEKGWLAKFSQDNVLLWSTYLGGNVGFDRISDITTNSDGEIFIVGGTESSDLGTPEVYQENNLSAEGAGFLTKYDSNGFPVWYTYISDEIASPSITAITTSHNEETIYVAGSDSESAITFEETSHQSTNGGLVDAILFSFSAQDGTLNWGTFYGGESTEFHFDIESTQDGKLIITGSTGSSSNISTSGALNEDFIAGSNDGFIAAFNQSGEHLWGTYLGSDLLDVFIPHINVKENIIFYSASTSSGNLSIIGSNPLVSSIEGASFGNRIGYIAKLNSSGHFIWSSYSNPDYECSYCRVIAPRDDGKFACLGTFPDDSNNEDCLDNLSPDAYQTEYGGGFVDMAFYFYNDNTLSIANQEFEPLNIYPNPSSDFVTVEVPKLLWASMNLTVTDLSGRRVDQVNNFKSGNTYSTNHLAEGIYILTGRMGERMFREKLVVSD